MDALIKSQPRSDLLKRVQALGMFALFLSACHNTSPVTGPSYVNIAGNWIGTYTTAAVNSSPVTMALTQNVGAVSGTYALDGGARTGTVSGTVDGNSAKLQFTGPSSCAGSFTVTLGEQGNGIQVFLNGSDCHGAIQDATGQLSRS